MELQHEYNAKSQGFRAQLESLAGTVDESTTKKAALQLHKEYMNSGVKEELEKVKGTLEALKGRMKEYQQVYESSK